MFFYAIPAAAWGLFFAFLAYLFGSVVLGWGDFIPLCAMSLPAFLLGTAIVSAIQGTDDSVGDFISAVIEDIKEDPISFLLDLLLPSKWR